MSANPNGLQEMKSVSPLWKAIAILYLLLTLAYDVSPVDVMPDAIPVIGWLDDLGLTLTAVLNIIQQFANDQNSFMIKFVKWVKWIFIIMLLILFLAVGGLIALIISLFS